MPADQRVELLVGGRRNARYAVSARYVGHLAPGGTRPPRRLTPEEREAVARAGRTLADGITGVTVDELEMQNAVELLHRLSRETEGEPHFVLDDGRMVASDEVAYRVVLD
jgi:hypothetical protein